MEPFPFDFPGHTRTAGHPNVALSSYLRANHSAIGIQELHRLGFDKDTITTLVRRQVLVRVHRGVYRAGAVDPPHATTLRCATLAVGTDAAIARASSAHFQGFIDFPPHDIEVVSPRRRGRRPPMGLAVYETRALHDHDVVLVDGIRCTGSDKTILDLAQGVTTGSDYRLLRRALRQATVRDKGLPGRLSTVLRERSPFRGSRTLRELLAEHTFDATVTRSGLEDAFLDLLIANGIPLPETNAVVEGFEVDGVWRKERVVAELDTFAYHGDVRSFERDRARDLHLTVAGYRPIRVTDQRIRHHARQLVWQTRTLLGI